MSTDEMRANLNNGDADSAAKKAADEQESEKGEGKDSAAEQKQRDVLLSLLGGDVQLFHFEGNSYVTFQVEVDRDGETQKHHETWPVRSEGFKLFLRRAFYKKTEATLDPKVLAGVVDLSDAQARWDGPSVPVLRRVARDGHTRYLDLCDDQWRVEKRSLSNGGQAPGARPGTWAGASRHSQAFQVSTPAGTHGHQPGGPRLTESRMQT